MPCEIESRDDQRLAPNDGGCVGDARLGGSSGNRPVTADGGAGSVAGRDGAGAGVPESVIARGGCDGDFGGIMTTAGRPGG